MKKWLVILLLFLEACSSHEPKPFSHFTEPNTGMDFIAIPKGEFLMGNSDSQKRSDNSDQVHRVKITHGFWLATTEVTQKQWKQVMGDKELHPEKPSPFWGENPEYPKVSVSYYDVQQFLEKLEDLSPGNHFRLPTEAEWEYACRAGTTTNFAFGSILTDSLACFNSELSTTFSIPGTKPEHPQEVGSFPPNKWGLYDMHGNVFEWVSDWYDPYSSEDQINPKGPENGELKVIRGGSWYFSAEKAQSFYRMTHAPSLWGFSIGFRIVMDEK